MACKVSEFPKSFAMVRTPCEPAEVLTWSTHISLIDLALGIDRPSKGKSIDYKISAARSRNDCGRPGRQHSRTDKCDKSCAVRVSHDLRTLARSLGLGKRAALAFEVAPARIVASADGRDRLPHDYEAGRLQMHYQALGDHFSGNLSRLNSWRSCGRWLDPKRGRSQRLCDGRALACHP